MKKVCEALAEWIAERNLTASSLRFPGVKIQVVFRTESDAWEAMRAFKLDERRGFELNPLVAQEELGRQEIAGIPFEFVGPVIRIDRWDR